MLEGAFSYCGDDVWNKQPADLRTIGTWSTLKNKLKTFIFIGLNLTALCVRTSVCVYDNLYFVSLKSFILLFLLP